MRGEFPYSGFFWSVFSPNAEKYGPEKLRIRTLLTQCNNDREITFGSLSKLEKTVISTRKFLTSFLFYQFTANLEQSRG